MRTYKIPQTLALLALSVLAGCSSDGTEATDALADDSRLIRFTMAGTDGATTRTASAYTGETFHVMADLGSTAYMPDQVATKSGSEWKTSTSYYLPTSGTLRFYAYNGLTPNSRTAGTAPTFNVTDQKTNQTDLLTYTTDVAYDASGAVPIQFDHAMSAVWFSIKSGSMAGTVGNITIPGVNNSGTYTIGTGWSDLGSSTDYVVAYSSHNSTSSNLLIIPQDLSGKTVTIQFTPTGGSQTNLTATLPTLNLQPGYRYELQLEISTDVKITNTITPWNNETTNKVVSIAVPPTGTLPGQFTINAAGDKVFFSKGNLQATTTDLGENWTYSFAEQQWAIIGGNVANNKITGDGTVSENGSVDLFGWSTDATTYGINVSNSASTYTGDFRDWGTLPINNGGNVANSGWRTLTIDEWKYLFGNEVDNSIRPTTSGIFYVRANVNGINGFILLPDDWDTSYYSLVENSTNTISSIDVWTDNLEAHGAVFLPLTGCRNRTNYANSGYGYYWSSTTLANQQVYIFHPSGAVYFDPYPRYHGFAVRLVYPIQ